MALKLACNAGNEKCLSDTFKVNRHLIEDGQSIPKGLEGVVLCSGFRGTGKQTQWNELYRIMQTTTDSTFKTQIRNALGCTDDADSLKNYLESTVSGDSSNSYTETERQNVLSAVLNSRSGLSAVMNFINDFESDIVQLFGYATLENVLNVPARTIKTRNQETIFVNFINSLTNLEGTNSSRITAIIDNNFEVQQRVQYTDSIDFIRQYLNQRTSTVEQTEPTNAPTVTVPTEPSPTTPSGGSTLGFKITTLFASLLLIFICKM